MQRRRRWQQPAGAKRTCPTTRYSLLTPSRWPVKVQHIHISTCLYNLPHFTQCRRWEAAHAAGAGGSAAANTRRQHSSAQPPRQVSWHRAEACNQGGPASRTSLLCLQPAAGRLPHSWLPQGPEENKGKDWAVPLGSSQPAPPKKSRKRAEASMYDVWDDAAAAAAAPETAAASAAAASAAAKRPKPPRSHSVLPPAVEARPAAQGRLLHPAPPHTATPSLDAACCAPRSTPPPRLRLPLPCRCARPAPPTTRLCGRTKSSWAQPSPPKTCGC